MQNLVAHRRKVLRFGEPQCLNYITPDVERYYSNFHDWTKVNNPCVRGGSDVNSLASGACRGGARQPNPRDVITVMPFTLKQRVSSFRPERWLMWALVAAVVFRLLTQRA